MARVIVALLLFLTIVKVTATDQLWCIESVEGMEDEKLLVDLKSQQQKVSNPCLQRMVELNKFESAKYAVSSMLDETNEEQVNQVYDIVTKGSEAVQAKYNEFSEKIQERKRKPIVTLPPFRWFQTLNTVAIEIKYASRLDVAGCAATFNETIQITQTEFYAAASCAVTQDTNLFYMLDFPFWGAVNTTSYKMEHRPVGLLYFAFDKLEKGRWRSLQKEGTPKIASGKIWLEQHQNVWMSLYEYEDDEIEDFDGHDLVEPPEEVEAEDMTWLFPTKGPGEFKKKKGKKGKKKRKGKKKKSKKNKGNAQAYAESQ